MSREPLCLVIALVATTACATDLTAPTDTRAPSPPSAAFSWITSYQPSVLPLQFAPAINSSGAVVGRDTAGTGFYYAQGVATPLPLLAGVVSVDPRDLTDDGRIVAQGSGSKALYYSSPTSSPINIGAPRWAEPEAMNDQGVVVGRYGAPGRVWGAFRWTPTGGFMDITPAAYTVAWPMHVSESGYVVGWAQLPNNEARDFRWNPGGATGVELPPTVTARQALESGAVLVRYPGMGTGIWTPTSFSPVGPDPSLYSVRKISPNGRYVGYFWDPATGKQRAWTSIGTGSAIVLPLPPGFVSSSVTDVNACGTVLGHGTRASGESSAIVWSRSFTCDLPAAFEPIGTTSTTVAIKS